MSITKKVGFFGVFFKEKKEKPPLNYSKAVFWWRPKADRAVERFPKIFNKVLSAMRKATAYGKDPMVQEGGDDTSGRGR